MGIFEIISAFVLIFACVFIVVVVLMKDTKTQMSQTISGTSSDTFFQKNAGRTKEAMLNKATIAAAIIFFVLALAVNVINVYGSGKDADTGSSSSAASSDSSDTSDNSDTSDTSDGSDTSDTSSEAESSGTETSNGDTESGSDAASE